MPSEVKAQDTTSLASIKTVNEAATQSRTLLAEMEQAAQDAGTTLDGIYQDAKDAQTAADSAKQSADTAFTNLSQVQSVLEVAQWIATHGTYVKATVFNPNAIYYTITATQVTEPSDDDKDSQGVLIYYELDNGTYVRTTDTNVDEQKTYYRVTGTPVAQPSAEYIADYYTLAVSEAMADYVQSHLALTNDGLYVMADDSDWRVLIKSDGVYILDTNDLPRNRMTSEGNIIGTADGQRLALSSEYLKLVTAEQTYPIDFDLNGTSEEQIVYEKAWKYGERILNKTIYQDLYYNNPDPDSDRFNSEMALRPLEQSWNYPEWEMPYITTERTARPFFQFHIPNPVLAQTPTFTPETSKDVIVTENCTCELYDKISDTQYGQYGGVSITPTLDVQLGSSTPATVKAKAIIPYRQDSIVGRLSLCIIGVFNGGYTVDWNIYACAPYTTDAITLTTDIEEWNASQYTVIAPAPCFSLGTPDGSKKGAFSFSAGYGLSSKNGYQTTLGKYNNNMPNTVFEIGNGTDENNRSNAFVIKWDGDAELAIDTTAASGTDYEIYSALQSLGWDSDVIV